MFESITFLEVLQFREERSDKLWGRFQLDDDTWHVFWCAWKGSSSFKTHGVGWEGMIGSQRSKNTKLKKGYKTIDYQEVVKDWPEFPTMMLERFTWHKLLSSAI
jgi:hypothetical protein